MNRLVDSTQNHPIRWAGSLQALIIAVLGTLQVFEIISLTEKQIGAILVCYGALMGFLSEVLYSGSKKGNQTE